jgi:aspartyl-tRNA(Asn)/glutamyl-tRNA(Gln) amidotransferase subunit B
MNSFRFLQQALESEIPRQVGVLEAGGRIEQETLHFDPETGTTSPLRSKEEAHDYRYFPEPDLVPLVMDPAWIEEVRAALPELPAARTQRFMLQYGLSRYDAFLLGESGPLARFYEQVVAVGVDPKAAANWTMGEYLAYTNEAGIDPGQGFMTAERLAALVKLVTGGAVSFSAAKDVFRFMLEEHAEPADLVEKHGLGQISDQTALAQLVADLVAASPEEVAAYRAGKEQLIGFFVGQVMKTTSGRANPKLVNELVRAALTA